MPAMVDPALCFSVLAISAAWDTATSQIKSQVRARKLIEKALEHLRDRIHPDQSIADTTIMAFSILWGASYWLGDPGFMRSFKSSVYGFVQSRGGLDRLGLAGGVASVVHNTDILHSVTTAESCNYQNPTTVGPIEKALPISPNPDHFWVGEDARSLIEPRLLQTCLEFCRLIDAVELQDEQWGMRPYLYTLSKIGSIENDLCAAQATHKGTRTLNEHVCYAAVIHATVNFHMTQELWFLLTNMASRSTQALKEIRGSNYWQGKIELLMWVLFSVLLVPHDFEDKAVVTNILSKLVADRFDDEDEWPGDWRLQIRNILGRFMWSNKKSRAGFSRICDSIEQAVQEGAGTGADG